MKQVLLYDTAIATSNIGDEVILDGVKDGLKDVLDESLTFRLGTHIENWSPIRLWSRIIKPNWKVRVICDKADYKFIAGTNCITDDFLRKGQWVVNDFNKRLYKDCILVGVGRISDYDMPNKFSQHIYKAILSKDFKHSVRDEGTKRVIEAMGFKAINTGCPTLWGFTPEKCARIPKKKAKNVILSVSGYPEQLNRELDQKMINILKKNYENVYAWIQTAVDEEYLRSLENTENIACIYSFAKFKKTIQTSDVDYVGTRLHGGIFAMQNNCRSLIVSIDERARGFSQTNNIPVIERSDIEKNLERVINDKIVTDIKVDREAINEFLGQFTEKE